MGAPLGGERVRVPSRSWPGPSHSGCPQASTDEAASVAPPVPPVPRDAEAPPAFTVQGQPYSEAREACRERDPWRKVHWGELHVHSALSMDAYLWDVRGSADDVYRFAKGEEVGLAPYDPDGKALRTAQLERPLDFAALTDHASYQGEVALCTRPGSPKYESEGCKIYRGEAAGRPGRTGKIRGEDVRAFELSGSGPGNSGPQARSLRTELAGLHRCHGRGVARATGGSRSTLRSQRRL